MLVLSLVAVMMAPACQEKQQAVQDTANTAVEATPAAPTVEPSVAEGKLLKYSVFNKVKSETRNKAQVLLYAYLEQEPTTESELENTLIDLYEQNKNEDGYNNFDRPTVVGAYLFTSKKLGQQDKAAWIGMLMKGPNDAQPRISIDKLKLKGQRGLKDNETSEDEVVLANLNKTLAKRGLELCSFSKQLSDIELECIHKADRRYPDYGMDHMAYVDKLTEAEMVKIQKRHRLSDDIFTKVSVFAGVYCK